MHTCRARQSGRRDTAGPRAWPRAASCANCSNVGGRSTSSWTMFRRVLAQAAQDAAGDRAERHVVAPARPADDEQDADLALAFFQRRRVERARGRVTSVCARTNAPASQRERRVRHRVAQQLPRDGRRFADFGDDLDARVVEVVLQPAPTCRGVVGRFEHGVEQLSCRSRPCAASMRAAIVGAGSSGYCKIIFEVPAQVFSVLVGVSLNSKSAGGGWRGGHSLRAPTST